MSGRDEDLRAIRRVAEDWRKGWLAGDAASLIALYAEEPVVLPEGQPAIIGKKAIRSIYQSVLEEYAFESESRIIEVDASGDLGYFWSSYEMTGRPKAGGEPAKSRGKSIFILKRQAGGAWKIIRLIDNSDGPPPPHQSGL